MAQTTNWPALLTFTVAMVMSTNCYFGRNGSSKYLHSPFDSIREDVFTVSPKRQNRGIFSPTTPAHTGPETHIHMGNAVATMHANLKNALFYERMDRMSVMDRKYRLTKLITTKRILVSFLRIKSPSVCWRLVQLK